MQPTSRDICDSPNQAKIWKKRDYDSLECVDGNSGPKNLFIKVIVINQHKNPLGKGIFERGDRDLHFKKD